METPTLDATLQEKLVQALGRTPLFRLLKPELMPQLLSAAEIVSFAPGETIVRQGENADAFFVRPGVGALVHSTGITPASGRQGALFFVADTGVRYGVENRDTATLLGFGEATAPAPWPILGLLAPGPELGREAAFLAHDGVAPDDHPADVSPR